jgi:hypothetical protein
MFDKDLVLSILMQIEDALEKSPAAPDGFVARTISPALHPVWKR